MKVYCISMEKNPEKIIENISSNGFPQVKIFDAVNGKALAPSGSKFVSVFALENLLQKNERRYHAELGTWGAVGCYLSHVSLWQQLVQDTDDESYLIFEDDVMFSNNFANKYTKCMENIPKNWDILFLDLMWNEKETQYNDYFYTVRGHFFGTHAYIINKKCASALLTSAFPIEIQIDSYMSYFGSQNNLNYYTAKNLCYQKPHVSSIQTTCVICNLNSEKINLINKYAITLVILFICVIILIIYYLLRCRRQKKM